MMKKHKTKYSLKRKKYNKEKHKNGNGFNTDRFLFLLLSAVFSVVVLSQIGLFTKPFRSVFTNIDSYEGTKVFKDDAESGKITMTLADGTPGNNIEIMVNGEKVDVFDLKSKDLVLMGTSVVEIYAKDLEHDGTVKVDYVSENLDDTTNFSEVRIKNGYNYVGRFVYSD